MSSDEKNLDAELEDKQESVDTTDVKNTDKVTQRHRKGHHTVLWALLAVLAVLLIIPVFVAAWFGFVPGLSSLLGVKNPRDLGVTYTEADYQSYLDKTNVQFQDFANAPDNPDKPGKKTIFADPVSVTNQQFTQEELTAAINSIGWAWMPLTNAQVRLSESTVEISGNLNIDNIDKFIGFIGGVGYSSADVNRAVDWGKRLVGNAPVYIKARGEITNGQLNLNVQQVQVGRFNAPLDISSTVLSTGTQNSISNAANFSADNVTIGDGSLTFSGTYPTTVYVKY